MIDDNNLQNIGKLQEKALDGAEIWAHISANPPQMPVSVNSEADCQLLVQQIIEYRDQAVECLDHVIAQTHLISETFRYTRLHEELKSVTDNTEERDIFVKNIDRLLALKHATIGHVSDVEMEEEIRIAEENVTYLSTIPKTIFIEHAQRVKNGEDFVAVHALFQVKYQAAVSDVLAADNALTERKNAAGKMAAKRTRYITLRNELRNRLSML